MAVEEPADVDLVEGSGAVIGGAGLEGVQPLAGFRQLADGNHRAAFSDAEGCIQGFKLRPAENDVRGVHLL